MSELEIDHGGAIAVDPEVLREVGTRVMALALRFDDACTALRRAQGAVASAPVLAGQVDAAALAVSAHRIAELHTTARDTGLSTLLMADVFEVVELRAAAESLAVSDAAAAAAARARLDQLLASDPRLAGMADRLEAGWRSERFEGLAAPWDGFGLAPTLLTLGATVAVLTGQGKVGSGARLTGKADAVAVKPVHTSTPRRAPGSIESALHRFPKTPGAQVGVERYTMPDSSQRFAVYVKGTQSLAFGGADPWDMRSNVQLYSGEKSASYQATVDALEASGAKPGDRVVIVGHSQGGAIAGRVAMEAGYDVDLVVTAGSPDEMTVDVDQLIVQLRHTDDVVSSMAGGGSPEGTGSPDSFTARRVADPWFGPQDLALQAHSYDEYLETAAMVDSSGDPRVESVEAVWADLSTAVEITSTDYRADRIDDSSGGNSSGR